MSLSKTNLRHWGSYQKNNIQSYSCALKFDIQDVSDSFPVCTSQEGAGYKAAIHALCQTFMNEATTGALLVARNNKCLQFNQQTRAHVQVLSNTYKAPVHCVIQGGGKILSSEGTTQTDLFTMQCMPLL